MQGSGISSENIWTAFDTMTTASVRHIRQGVKVAWTRIKSNSVVFAEVGTSLVGGLDIVQGQSDIITEPDKFKYFDEDEYVTSLSFDRVLQEPLGGISYCIGTVDFGNATKRYTWGFSNTIGTALKSGRPVKLFTGFRLNGTQRLVPVMYGLTDKLFTSRAGVSAGFNCFDYIAYINDFELETTIFTNTRSDQIIGTILQTMGFTSSQYVLDQGLNTISFAWFQKGDKAGDKIRELCEAEEAHFYQDERGIIRFENRRAYAQAPRNGVVWTINKEDVLDFEDDRSVQIINRCIVKANPRSVRSTAEVWRDGLTVSVDGSGSLTVWASFENPVTAITTPVSTTDYVANDSSDGSGTDRTSSVSLVVTPFAQSAKIVITNAHASTVHMTLLRLRGTPAIVTSEIEEIAEDAASQDTYGRHQLIIENDYIDSRAFANYLASAIVTKYANPMRRIVVTVPAIPHLQLKDKVRVQDPENNTYKEFRVMRIRGKMTTTNFLQTLVLREVTATEADEAAASYGLVGTAIVGTDIVGI